MDGREDRIRRVLQPGNAVDRHGGCRRLEPDRPRRLLEWSRPGRRGHRPGRRSRSHTSPGCIGPNSDGVVVMNADGSDEDEVVMNDTPAGRTDVVAERDLAGVHDVLLGGNRVVQGQDRRRELHADLPDQRRWPGLVTRRNEESRCHVTSPPAEAGRSCSSAQRAGASQRSRHRTPSSFKHGRPCMVTGRNEDRFHRDDPAGTRTYG